MGREIAVKNSNTDEVAQMLRCSASLTAESSVTRTQQAEPVRPQQLAWTDHGILRKYGLEVVAPKSPWSVKDRLNATNWLICNAEGQRRLFVHPRCKNTIKGYRSVTFKEGSRRLHRRQGSGAGALDRRCRVFDPVGNESGSSLEGGGW